MCLNLANVWKHFLGGDTEAELGVAELLNRHMGQTEPSYSDVEDDYY